MSGFVAPTRAVQARPRLGRIDRPADDSPRPAPDVVGSPAVDVDIVDRTERVSEGRVALATRWQAIRERWAQATFYLFDPNAWR